MHNGVIEPKRERSNHIKNLRRFFVSFIASIIAFLAALFGSTVPVTTTDTIEPAAAIMENVESENPYAHNVRNDAYNVVWNNDNTAVSYEYDEDGFHCFVDTDFAQNMSALSCDPIL